MYQWIVFAHLLGIFGFLLGHGAAAAVAFKVRGERETQRIATLLDLSASFALLARVSLLVLLVAGVTLGFMGHWWGHGWIWASLAIFAVMSGMMAPFGSNPFGHVRKLLQTGPSGQGIAQEKEIVAALSAVRPWALTVIGGGGMVIILWLMLFKPF